MEDPDPAQLPLTEALLPYFMLGLFAYGILEWALVHFRQRATNNREYTMALKGMGFTGLFGAGFTAAAGPVNKVLFAFWGASLAPLSAGLNPLGCVYGLFIYEMSYWLQHWLAHKVRLLWCLHSPHHAPRAMNMFVGFNHSFLETIFYMPFMLGFIPAILGVDPVVIIVITFVDVVWGNLLHISDRVVTRRWGILEKFMQTPSFHRVHHARNVRYMDTNYNSITQLGDRLMGTLQPLDDREPVQFGITRDVDTGSFLDVHFGEFVALYRDCRAARSLREVLGYLFLAPGWQPTGEQKTASALKRRALQQAQHPT